jgi:hypothetical protein
LNQKVEATTTALMGLAGIAGDAVHSREHILISNLLLNAWTHGRRHRVEDGAGGRDALRRQLLCSHLRRRGA